MGWNPLGSIPNRPATQAEINALLGKRIYGSPKTAPTLKSQPLKFATPRFVPSGTISAPERTVGGLLEGGLANALMRGGVSPYMANRFAGRTLGFFNDTTPVGNVTGADEGGRQFMSGVSRGDLRGAGLGAVSFGLSVLPLPGGVKRAAKKAGMFGSLMRDQSGAIRAWHGSPHDFDRFDMSKIGTGEGAQAYGHGLYFAENKGVAERYRDDLSRNLSVNGQPILANNKRLGSTGNRDADDYLLAENGDIERAIASVKAHMSEMQPWQVQRGGYQPILQTLEGLRGKVDNKVTGRLYEVNIDANPEDFLDWDAPLKAQPQPVAGALAGLSGLDPERGLLETLDPRRIVYEPDMYGAEVYHRVGTALNGADRIGLVANHNAKQKAMDALRASGIPGIRYLDQGSRGAGNGTRNYVVFDDSLIDILNKY